MPLRNLIAWAYRTDPFRVVDGPSWITDQHYDVVGIPKAGAGWDDEMPDMLQKALVERFSMKTQTEQRPMAVYALKRLRAETLGPNLRSSTLDCAQKVSDRPGCWLSNSNNSVKAVGRDWRQINLVQTLRRSMGEMVVDDTGLTGKFDMTLDWTVGTSLSGQLQDQVSVFTALREQLGLQLVRETRRVEVVSIKSIGALIAD